MSENKQEHAFVEILKRNAWGIVIAIVVIITNFTTISNTASSLVDDVKYLQTDVTNIKIQVNNDLVTKQEFQSLVDQVKANEEEIEAINLAISTDLATLITQLRNVDGKMDRVFGKLDEYDRNIRLFYEKYDLTPKKGNNE